MTKTRTKWIEDAAVTKDKLNADVAGDALTGGAGSALDVDIDAQTVKTYPAKDDVLLLEDSEASFATKKILMRRLPAQAPQGDGSFIIIYVRTTGNDTTGDGKAVGTAYRTIRRALEDVPFIIYNNKYIIECSGLGQELNTDTTTIPAIFSPDSLDYTSTRQAGFVVTAPLTFEAAPTLIDTITAPQLTGQTTDSTTGLRTLQTTKNYTLDQHKTRFIRDANNRISVIASNTAGPNSDIELSERDALTAPIEIMEQSCEIRNSDVSGGNALQLNNLNACVAFNGIKLTTANTSSFRYGLYVTSQIGRVNLTGCYVDGHWTNMGLTQPAFSGSYITKRFAGTGCSINLFDCFVESAVVAFRNTGTISDTNFWFYSIFDDCTVLGGGTGIEEMNRFSARIDKCEIRNGQGDGVYIGAGGVARVRQTNIKDCVGDAVWVNRGYLVLNKVNGSGNGGLGAKVENGSQVQRKNAGTVTGTSGDYKCGGNAIGTWGAFTGNEVDTGAASPQLCRLYT